MSKEHLDYVKKFWNSILHLGDIAIDATVGNGYDTQYLAQKVLSKDSGYVYGYDIQENAISNTRQLLENTVCNDLLQRIALFHKSHDSFNDLIDLKGKIRLFTYNLGYLPGSDKSITTLSTTTTASLMSAIHMEPDYISIVCYPGHAQGKIEEQSVMSFLSSLDRKTWTVSMMRWLNRKSFPSVVILQKNS